MKPIAMALFTLLALAPGMRPGQAQAQVPGAMLEHGAFEAGFLLHDFSRSLEYNDTKSTLEGQGWSGFMRMGVTSNVTASAELAGGIGGADIGNFRYTVGASIQTAMWTHGVTRATTSIGYTQSLNVYRDSAGGDLLIRNLDWNALLEHAFSRREQDFTVWAGPTLTYMATEPQAPAAEHTSDSIQVFGGILGVRGLLWSHLSVTAQGTWVNSFEPSLTLGYRF